MVLHLKSLFLLVSLIFTSALFTVAQENKPEEKPKKEEKKEAKQQKGDPNKNATAEQVAESVIYIYGGAAGRNGLNQIRKTTFESGKLSLMRADGTTDLVNYERRILRGENLEKEKIRFDQETPSARYALIYNGNKIVGLFNETVFTPQEEAAKSFQNQIWHGLEALLRYKENNSTLNLVGREKYMGVDFHILEVTDKENRKTRFYVSTKTFRVMWLEYAEGEVNYTRRFYDYRYAQGTLVPYRSILLANGKQIEETTVSTSTFGQKLDEEMFNANE